jgi:prepilin-type N-terminal cleavage/methylation domain-containing protein
MSSLLHTKEYQRGFTLVETLVAITILLVVIVGPMTIAQKGMQSAYYAGDQTTAIYLAQEAIEYIQQLRDNVALNEFQQYKAGTNNGADATWSWYTSLDSDCKDSDGCDIDFIGGDYEDCGTSGACVLRMNSITTGNRVYGYGSGWATSKFERRIRVGTAVGATATAAGGVPVTVTVSWNSGALFNGAPKSVVLQTYVYDHYTRFE